jgi:Flp pilus assembly protein TadG
MIRRWLTDRRGNAAIELALVAPVFAGVAVMSFGVWEAGARNQDARSALDVSVQYYMNGGTDDTVATTLGLSGWRHKPANGNITSSRSYRCGDTTATSTTICTGGRTPGTYVTLTATATSSQALVHPTLTLNRVVRVR